MTVDEADYICGHLSQFDAGTILTAILLEMDNGRLAELRKNGHEDALFIWTACELENLLLSRKDIAMKIMLDGGAYMPERAHPTDAGLDLKTPEDFFIGPKHSRSIDTGVHVEIPAGCVGFLKSKSGLNVKYGITSEGVIDEGYTGSICVKLYNNHPFLTHEFKAGEKISQLVILPVIIPDELEVVDELESSGRGDSGFGSSGR